MTVSKFNNEGKSRSYLFEIIGGSFGGLFLVFIIIIFLIKKSSRQKKKKFDYELNFLDDNFNSIEMEHKKNQEETQDESFDETPLKKNQVKDSIEMEIKNNENCVLNNAFEFNDSLTNEEHIEE